MRLSLSLLAILLLSPQVLAGFDARDCSIWLCMPFGFPNGCEDAKDAFKDRLKHFKSPLPRIEKCWLNTDSAIPTGDVTQSMDAVQGSAAYIPEHQECQRYEIRYDGRVCVQSVTIPPQAIKDKICTKHDNSESPDGCTQTINYTDFLMNGEPYQDTYYFDNKGNAIDVAN
ncbi:TPA: conjugal transfer protein TraL [Vibrio parahaemolyticus]